MRSEPIMPHYVNVASGKFFWRGFLLRAVAALVCFFANTFLQTIDFICKKQSSASVLAAKTMTKKLPAPRRRLVCCGFCALAQA